MAAEPLCVCVYVLSLSLYLSLSVSYSSLSLSHYQEGIRCYRVCAVSLCNRLQMTHLMSPKQRWGSQSRGTTGLRFAQGLLAELQ